LLAFIEAQGIQLVFTENIAPALGVSYGEAADARAYNRRTRELAAEDAARGEGLLSMVFGFFFSKSRRY